MRKLLLDTLLLAGVCEKLGACSENEQVAKKKSPIDFPVNSPNEAGTDFCLIH